MATKKNSASEIAYQSIRKQILSLELAPGTAINETATATKYNISRTPVRDIFKTLEAEGLLEIKPHSGTFVSLIDLEVISSILYVREAVSQAVLTDLATAYDQSQAYRIQLALKEQKEILDSEISNDEMCRAFIIADNHFNDILYDIAGKKNVAALLSSYNSQYERFRSFVNLNEKRDLLRLYNDHVEIAEYLATGNFEQLRNKTTQHNYYDLNSAAPEILKHPEYFRR